MTKDSFIFSVHQAHVARMKSNGSFDSHLRFEPFLEGTWKLEENPTLASFKKEAAQIVEHHFTILPNYKRDEVVDLENISWFAHSIAVLFADLETLLLAYTGNGFPLLTTAVIPHTITSKNIALAIKKYSDFKHKEAEEKYSLFPLLDDQEQCVDALYIQELWSLVAFFAKKFFGSYSSLITSYIEWKYVDKSVEKEVIDWNVRPPCGAAYRKEFKELFEEERNNRRFGSANRKDQGRRDHDRPAENVKPESNVNQIPQVESQGSDRKWKSPSYKERDGQRPKPAFNRFKKDFDENQINQTQNMDKALEEANLAMEKMKKDKDIPEISLTPQNSFVRREQHMVISQAGFGTESRGDDKTRCVCITRKEPS
jgi:hypothetical protein